jgi:hypothetical protein
MRNRSHSLAGLLAAAALVAASCGGPSYEPQTLDEFMGWDTFDEDAAAAAFEGVNRQIEQQVAACLAEKGYEVPDFPAEPEKPVWGEGLTDDEFLLRYGYGFFAAVIEDHRDSRNHETALRELWVCDDDAVVTEDLPVSEILRGCLSPMETWMEEVGFEEFMAAEEECEGPAQRDVRGEPDTELLPALEQAWRPLESALEEMWAELESDSRLVEAQEDWSACMADKGYDLDYPRATAGEPEGVIAEYLSPMMDEVEARGGLAALNAGMISVEEIQPYADIELALAAADVACRSDLHETWEELRAEHQGRFIAEHREQLARIRELEQRLMRMRLEGREPA